MRIDSSDLTLSNAAQTVVVAAPQAKATQTAADDKRYQDLVAAG